MEGLSFWKMAHMTLVYVRSQSDMAEGGMHHWMCQYLNPEAFLHL